MSNRYRLVGLRDEQGLRGVSGLVAQVNVLTADMLAHLVEVDSRMLYAELGFPNLFSYCVTSLRLSEGAAGRRCVAARVCRRFPEAFELVAKGELHLSALCALSKRLEPENAAELFQACRGKSRRRIDEILAARFPRPDAEESIRPQREIEPTSAGRYKVQFTADAKLRELIERACALCPDRSPQGQLAHVIARGLELFVAQQERRRFAVGCKPRKAHVAVATETSAGDATPGLRQPPRSALRQALRQAPRQAPRQALRQAPRSALRQPPHSVLRQGLPDDDARLRPRFGALSMNATRGVALGWRGMAGAVRSARGWSSITWSLGRTAPPMMRRIFDYFVRLTIGCMHGTALAPSMSRPRLRRGVRRRDANRVDRFRRGGLGSRELRWRLVLRADKFRALVRVGARGAGITGGDQEG